MLKRLRPLRKREENPEILSNLMRKMLARYLNIRQAKRAQRLAFWVRRPPGGVGVFHAKGWKVCLPWVSKRGIQDVPGILLGCPGPLGLLKKFVQKKFVRLFRSLHQCANWVHCKRRGSEKSTFLAVFRGGGGDLLRCACSPVIPVESL